MWQFVRKAWWGLWRRPWLAASGLVLVGLAALLISLDIWALGCYRAAEKSLGEEKFAEARGHLQDCQSVWWWQTADTYFLAARLERLLGNYPEAGNLLEKVNSLRSSPNEATQVEAKLLRAETGYLFEVEQNLLTMVGNNHRDTPQILRTLAKVYILQWRYPAALTALNRLLDLKPNSGETLEWRGLMWERMKNNGLAEKDFRQSLAVAPHRIEARLSLVQLLVRAGGQPKEILEHLHYLLAKQPNNPDYLLALAQCKTLQGDFPASRKVLDSLLELDPNHTSALFHRAQVEFQAGQFADAEEWARKAVAQELPEFKAYHVLAESLKRQNDPVKEQEAKIQENKYLKAREDSLRLIELLSGTFEKQKADPEVWTEIGGILLRAHKFKEGVQFLEGALALNPHHPIANNLLADYYKEKNQLEKAAQYQKEAKGVLPK